MPEKDKMQKQVEDILIQYEDEKRPLPQEEIVQILREVQEAVGYIPQRLQEKVAEAAGVGLSVVSCLVRMYPSLKGSRDAHTVTVCTGGRCQQQNTELLGRLKQEFKIGKNGVSKDGRIILHTRRCLKNCRMAPNVIVDGKEITKADFEHIRNLLKK